MEDFKDVKFSCTFDFWKEEHYHSYNFEFEDIKLKVELGRQSNFKYCSTLNNMGSTLLKVSSFLCKFSEGREKKLDFVLELNKPVSLKYIQILNMR